MKVVLASASPRRKELLQLIGLAPEVIPPDIEEAARPGEAIGDFLERVTIAKAIEVYKKKFFHSLLISADTVVLLDDTLIGKPANRADAFAMLRRLSGRRHEVLTGLALMYQGETRFAISRTRVFFKTLDDGEIDFYLDHENFMDKAGAYAIQGRAAIFVERIEGCYFNVMGFPLEPVLPHGQRQGIEFIWLNPQKDRRGKTVTLGATGLQVLRMGMGGIPIQRLDAASSDRVLEKALASGINFFDTARGYTDSESKLGRVLSRHRERVVIASKSFSRGAAEILGDVETSLRLLRTDHVDIYQCHNVASESDLEKILAADGAVAGLLKAREQGKILHIGLSGHKPRIVAKALSRFGFATIQVPCNFMETEAMPELIPQAHRQGVGVIAMKPVGGGNIRETALNFRFIFNHGVDVAIPGMDSERQVEENVAALEDLSALDAAETARLQVEKDRLGDSFCRRCEYCMPCPQGLADLFFARPEKLLFPLRFKRLGPGAHGRPGQDLQGLRGLRPVRAKVPLPSEHAGDLPFHLGKNAG